MWHPLHLLHYWFFRWIHEQLFAWWFWGLLNGFQVISKFSLTHEGNPTDQVFLCKKICKTCIIYLDKQNIRLKCTFRQAVILKHFVQNNEFFFASINAIFNFWTGSRSSEGHIAIKKYQLNQKQKIDSTTKRQIPNV